MGADRHEPLYLHIGVKPKLNKVTLVDGTMKKITFVVPVRNKFLGMTFDYRSLVV